MESLYLLIPVSGFLVLIIVGALLWAVKSGQFDDLEGPAYRILMDDDEMDITDSVKDKNSDKLHSTDKK